MSKVTEERKLEQEKFQVILEEIAPKAVKEIDEICKLANVLLYAMIQPIGAPVWQLEYKGERTYWEKDHMWCFPLMHLADKKYTKRAGAILKDVKIKMDTVLNKYGLLIGVEITSRGAEIKLALDKDKHTPKPVLPPDTKTEEKNGNAIVS